MQIEVIDKVSPAIDEAIKSLKKTGRRKLLKKLSVGLGNILKNKFIKNSAKPNRLKAPSTGWWKAAAKSVEAVNDYDIALITAKHRGLNAHYYGATIKPKNVKSLAIPISPEFHGRTPKEFPKDTFFYFRSKKGNSLLGVRSSPTLKPAFLLRKQTKVPMNRKLFPSDKTFQTYITGITNKYLEEAIQ